MQKVRMKVKKRMIAGLCLMAALVFTGCGGLDQTRPSTEKPAVNTESQTAEVSDKAGSEPEKTPDMALEENDGSSESLSYTIKGDTVYVEKSCFLPDVKAENATKIVLNGNIYLKDYDPGESDSCNAYEPPDCRSWFEGCPKVKKIEVRIQGKVPVSKEGAGNLYTDQGLLMYTGKSQGVYACPITKKGKVVVPDGTRDIYDSAFFDCTGIDTVILPKTVCWTGTAAFANASKLEKIVVAKDNPCLKSVDGVLYTKDGRVLLAYPAGKKDKSYRILPGVRYIADGAFMGAKHLEEVTIPKGVFSLGGLAFKNCTRLQKIHSNKVYFGNSSAYAYCDKLSSKEWVKSEEKLEEFRWEVDYREDFLSDWNVKFPWKFNIDSYGTSDADEVIETLEEFCGKVPERLVKKIRSLQHNYAKSILLSKAVTAQSIEDFEKLLDHFTRNYGK